MRVGAVDYGRRRIGMAICDPLGITVRGLETLTWQGPVEEAARVVAEALEDSGAERVVVGLPLLASGDDSPMSREARRFATALGRASGLPIELFDESLTSWEAEEELRRRGRSVREARRRGDVDRGAAMALLRSWLRERERHAPEGG